MQQSTRRTVTIALINLVAMGAIVGLAVAQPGGSLIPALVACVICGVIYWWFLQRRGRNGPS